MKTGNHDLPLLISTPRETREGEDRLFQRNDVDTHLRKRENQVVEKHTKKTTATQQVNLRRRSLENANHLTLHGTAHSAMDYHHKLPLYIQLVETIHNKIRAGHLKPGDRLPSERELLAQHKVSRTTVIQAVKALVQKGLLVRQAGRGTFISHPPVNPHPAASRRAVGVVIPSRGDEVLSHLFEGIGHGLHERELSMMSSFSKESSELEMSCLQHLAERGVGAVILFMQPTVESWENVQRFRQQDIPLVLLDHRHPTLDEDIDTVTSDNLGGASQAVNHLVRLGHRRIAMTTFPWRCSSVLDREQGYRLALVEHGLPYDPTLIVVSHPQSDMLESGQEAAQRLLALRPQPTAVLAINDTTAIGVIRYAQKLGLRVPEDLAVIGFDGIAACTMVEPSVTTVRQDFQRMGAEAARLAADRVQGFRGPARHEVQNVELVIRRSCGGAPGALEAAKRPDAEPVVSGS